MALPTNLTAGVSTGHLAHHATIAAARNADGGSLPTTYTEGQTGHDAVVHADIKAWYDAANPTSPLPSLPPRSDAAYGVAHETAHEIVHSWLNDQEAGSLPASPWSTHPGTFSTLTEEADYLTALDTASARVEVVQVGSSAQSRPIRLVIVGPPRTQAEIQAATTMLVVGSTHGDEISGRDAILNHMRAHAGSTSTETILYIPTVNPDGVSAETRNTSQGDMNRRWNESPLPYAEQIALKSVIVDYKPMVVCDTHEYTSTGTMFRFKPLDTHGTGTPTAVATESDTIPVDYLIPAAQAAGFSTGYYGGSIPDDGGTQWWGAKGIVNTFIETPKSSSGGPTLRVSQAENAVTALLTYVRANVSDLSTLRASQTYT